MVSELAGTERVIRLLIADDHPVVRNGLRVSFKNEPDIEIVGEAVDGEEAVDKALALQPDVVLMDVYMPHLNGLRAMLAIKEKLPDTRFLIMTVSEEEGDLFQAIRLGEQGYLVKRAKIEEVVDAVRKIAAGEALLSPQMAARVVKELQEGRKPDLSGREQEVLELLAQGLNNGEIASRLFLSQSTVGTYTYRLLRKLHLRNRAEAIAYFIRHSTYT